MSRALAVLKIGGSVVTDKTRDNCFVAAHVLALGQRLADGGALVVVHGTGSFGKPPAVRHGYLDGFLARERVEVVAEVEAGLDALRTQVLAALRAGGVRAIGIVPQALFRTCERRIERCASDALAALVDAGLVPVLSGGIVPDRARGFAVLSSDDIAAHLAIALGARRLVFATDTDGVLRDPRDPASRLDELTIGPTVGGVEGAARGERDVSGAMAGKLACAAHSARAGIPTFVADGRQADCVAALLRGQPAPATRVHCAAESSCTPPRMPLQRAS